VIEKRQKVVELARTHFCLVEDPLLQIHHTDAADFLAAPCADSYDLVLVDIHDPDGMSSAVGAESFFAACRQRLHRRGILSINLWSGEREEVLVKVRHNLEDRFARQVLYLPVARKRNCIGLAFNYELPPGLIKALRRRAAELGPRFGIEFPALLRALQKANPRQLGRRFF
jgi:spermidine synthase